MAANERQIISRTLEYSIRKRGVDANINAILDYLHANGMVANIETVPVAYNALGNRLIDSQRWADACDELRQARPDVEFNQAVFGILASVIDEDAELSSRSLDGDLLSLVFDEVDMRQPFARTRAYADKQAEIAERARLIAEISNGRTDFYEARDGGGSSYIKKFSVPELYDETTARLREIHGIVINQRLMASVDPKAWFEQKRKDEIRRQQQAVGMVPELPATWVLLADLPATDSEEGMPKGRAVPLTRALLTRPGLSREDLVTMIRKYGATAVNKIVGK
jgi:hypothetical protein